MNKQKKTNNVVLLLAVTKGGGELEMHAKASVCSITQPNKVPKCLLLSKLSLAWPESPPLRFVGPIDIHVHAIHLGALVDS